MYFQQILRDRGAEQCGIPGFLSVGTHGGNIVYQSGVIGLFCLALFVNIGHCGCIALNYRIANGGCTGVVVFTYAEVDNSATVINDSLIVHGSVDVDVYKRQAVFL